MASPALPNRVASWDTDDRRWLAVKSRDPSADGSFVYAVRTTHIYCRPICSARLARRANITFYASDLEAELQGFRACKRCKPDTVTTAPGTDVMQRLATLLDLREMGQQAAPSLEEMAAWAGMSKWHFHRKFKRHTGVTPAEYVRSRPSCEVGGPVLECHGTIRGSASSHPALESTPNSEDEQIETREPSEVDYMGEIWSEYDLSAPDLACFTVGQDEN